jgi:hypothetical protein
VGHSLGSYVVTMAACQDTGYLGPNSYSSTNDYGRIKVVVPGAAPDNLIEALQWFQELEYGFGYDMGAIGSAPEPKTYGKDLNMINNVIQYGYDHAKSIHLPFEVITHANDGTLPAFDQGIPQHPDLYSGYSGNMYPLWKDVVELDAWVPYCVVTCIWFHCWWTCGAVYETIVNNGHAAYKSEPWTNGLEPHTVWSYPGAAAEAVVFIAQFI